MSTVISRQWIYLLETFQVHTRFLLSAISVVIIYLYQGVQVDLTSLLIAFSTMFFSLLYYRVCDEFKDEDTDKKFFPMRPYPSGRVLRADLILLLYFCVLMMVGLALLRPDSLVYTLIVLLFCILMQKWFFMPKLIENNRILAFLTHSPYALVLNIALIGIICQGQTQLIFTQKNIWLLLALSIPGFHWEIIRKVFIKDTEGYQTYSSLLGYSNAIYLSILYIIISVYSLYRLLIPALSIFIISISVLYICYLLYLAAFKVESKVKLQTLAETITGLYIVTLLVNGVL